MIIPCLFLAAFLLLVTHCCMIPGTGFAVRVFMHPALCCVHCRALTRLASRRGNAAEECFARLR
ncbi:hypothetical protein CC86DRAFT_203509 [Ophiobolus disseminans]|uniref:Secreted protein n=1 Tax=Ophiobolus disseminans TaxID=1469910 RepID=A0A6A7A421_9PLEO|nr:hypothetical protein CC86DRAFT_203509 [Ophiobolus disseminans]